MFHQILSRFHQIFPMNPFYRFLHSLLTLLFSLLVYIPYYFKLTKRRLWPSNEPSLNDIKQDIATLTNLPRHISFLVFEQDIDFSIVARLIVWCVAAGISYVSVYDPKGVLKRKRTELYEEVSKMRQDLLDKKYELHFCEKSTNTDMTNGTENGCSKRKAFVSVLSSESGKEDIVKAAQVFCSSVNNQECQPKILDIQYFGTLLKGNHNFPDPDLALRFGQTDSLNGYLPWQIRLTEFLSISSLRIMDYELLLNSLKTYSKCEQRLGR